MVLSRCVYIYIPITSNSNSSGSSHRPMQGLVPASVRCALVSLLVTVDDDG